MPQSNQPAPEPKADSLSGAIKSRVELRGLFRNGRLPDESSFYHLIDALVHKNDLWEKPASASGGASGPTSHKITALNRSWYVYVDADNNLVVSESDAVRLRLNANDRVDIGGPDDPFALIVNGWTGIGMRVGTYLPENDARREFPSTALVQLQVPADGRWHPIIEEINGCHAFEVVASASGAKASQCHAITHAVAVTANSGGRTSIRQTHSYDGWDWRRSIRFKWQSQGGGWFKKSTNCSLCLRTGCDFGKGDDGNPVNIAYHITRMW